jgi:parallel beta-helix repeat protein
VNVINLAKLLVFLSFLVIIGFAFPTKLFVYSSRAPSSLAVSTMTRVRVDFMTIQEAINNANAGDTIFVPAGTYYEHVVVNKTVSLVGESNTTTIIDGSNAATVVQVTANWVKISGFKLQNSGWGWYRSGIETQSANNCMIENNILFHTCHNIRLNNSRDCIVIGNWIDHVNQMGYGIRLTDSVNCTVSNNFVAKNIGGIVFENSSNCTAIGNNVTRNSDGIRLYSSSSNNRITENTVYNNSYCGMIYPLPYESPEDNTIFHNSFINNSNPFIIQSEGNIWDIGYPYGGNFWSFYNGTDFCSGSYQNETGRDGIGDTHYTVGYSEVDRYPLMHPYGSIQNLDTNITYLTIQSAIDAPETLNGHTLWAKSETYHENIDVYKSLTLIGEDQSETIIDSDNVGTVLSINADNVNVSRFTIRNSGLLAPTYGDDCGVLLNHSASCSISHCSIVNNRIGIYLFFSGSNVIEHNVVYSNSENGILLWYSGNNVFENNEMNNNSYNLGVYGGSFQDFNNVIHSSNTVNGKPVTYRIDVRDEILDNQADTGVIYLINSVNVTVRNLNLTNNSHGIFCYNMTNSRIENVTANKNSYGIYLQDSNSNLMENSNCLENWVGICLQHSDYNTVKNCVSGRGEKGISLYEADSNVLAGNTIFDALYGIRLYSSHMNEIFHNNLVGNTNQADLISSFLNVWDNGLEGNYWSNHAGSDINKDGIGDAPYTVNNIISDRYPLLGPYNSFNVHYQEHLCEVSVISNSTILNFTFENNSNAIRLTVNGTDESYGFCRISVPNVLAGSEIIVVIDNGSTEVLYPNYNLHNDSAYRWIYFMYQHSTHEILLISEFWPVVALPILMLTTLLCLSFKRLRR